jgi:hypothetical protein
MGDIKASMIHKSGIISFKPWWNIGIGVQTLLSIITNCKKDNFGSWFTCPWFPLGINSGNSIHYSKFGSINYILFGWHFWNLN